MSNRCKNCRAALIKYEDGYGHAVDLLGEYFEHCLDPKPEDGRPTWQEYFLDGAEWAATRGECSRRQVGCLLVDQGSRRIVETGYNGAPAGHPSCLLGNCPRANTRADSYTEGNHNYDDCNAIHAEQNALLLAGRRARGTVAYVTHEPCRTCYKLLTAAGVVAAIWREGADVHSKNLTRP